MKHFKSLLAVVLALGLCVGLGAPAFAGDTQDSAMPVITKQPENVIVTPGIFGMFETDNTEFTLRIEASIPNGDPVGYQWYRISVSNQWKTPIQGATESTYSAYIGDVRDVSGWDYSNFAFCCVVYNAKEGLDGEHNVTSKEIIFERYPGLFTSILKIVGSVIGLPFSLIVPVIILPMLFLPFPLTMICIQGIQDGVAGVKHYFNG